MEAEREMTPDMRAVLDCLDHPDGRFIGLVIHGTIDPEVQAYAIDHGAWIHENKHALNFPGGTRLVLFDLSNIGARDELRRFRFRSTYWPDDTSPGDVALLKMVVKDPDEQLSERQRRRRGELPVRVRDPLVNVNNRPGPAGKGGAGTRRDTDQRTDTDGGENETRFS